MMDNTIYHNCSFCGKSRMNVKKLIAGPEAFICDECVMLSSKILSQEKEGAFLTNELYRLTPKTIKAEFDKYVIGQDNAKKVLSVVVHNHYKRMMFDHNSEIKDYKTNLLMIGATSTGKTLLIKVLQKMMQEHGIPIAFADATTLTEAGYVGEDVENIILRLLQEADFNIAKAQKGIVFIDEIDKIASKSGGSNLVRDVSGEGVQQALLGLLQGKVASVTPGGNRKNMNQESILVNTSDILFICAGAFCGLEKIVEERRSISHLGFNANTGDMKSEAISESIIVEDLIKFGMIPEFLGRLPVIVGLENLTQAQLVEILTKPNNALLKQYEKLFEINGAKLTLEPEAIEEIAKKAVERKVSARGLKGVIEEILQETMFELEDNVPCEIVLDRNAVINKKPILKKDVKKVATS